jgi:hypothetical protein
MRSVSGSENDWSNAFGWMKMIGMQKKVKSRGIDKVGWLFTFAGAAYNLCRLRNLMART